MSIFDMDGSLDGREGIIVVISYQQLKRKKPNTVKFTKINGIYPLAIKTVGNYYRKLKAPIIMWDFSS